MKFEVIEEPLVTVYITTYNRLELLKRALDSVLNQTYKNIEVIVVDDGSTDDTHSYLSSKILEDDRLTFHIKDSNSGACVSRNIAIKAAKGQFITGLDDDDYFLPSRIKSFVDYWNIKDGNCIALYTNTYILKPTNKEVKSKKIDNCTPHDLIFDNRIGNQIFTKTTYLKEINGFDVHLPAWQDLECWYNLLNHFNGYATLVPEPNYVFDESHPHERITNKKTEYIIEAYNYMCNKHNLKPHERDVLRLQLHPYTGTDLKLKYILDSFRYFSESYNRKRSWSLLTRYLKSQLS